ncbi:MAG: aminoglycoside adenylyltransferase family protein [Castellaniella sp.]|uniref:Aminoglycoside (3'') (9) adenylyltransferase n=1 Tax=Castellaniella hirudinis TaxID=1144617 RepID=A0ABV8S0P0_9BURK
MMDSVPSAIAPQVARARAVLERHLGGRIVSIHLFGSAVDDRLRPYSDIDLLVTVTEPPGKEVRRALMADLLAASAPPGASPSTRALEVTVLALEHIVPWRYPPRRELQFGEWLRDEIAAGSLEAPVLDHDLAVLLTKVRAGSIAIAGPRAASLFDAVPRADLTRALVDTVAQWNKPADWTGDERNIILALARCWYTASTGEIASKHAAAAWLLERIDPPYRTVLTKARSAYLGEAQDDLATHAPEVEAFIAHAQLAVKRLCLAQSVRGHDD